MSGSQSPAPARARGVVRGVLVPLLCAGLALLALWATWRIFVVWPTGQMIDDAGWQGSLYQRERVGAVIGPVVRVISEPFLVLAAIAAFIIAALQRRWSIAVAATVMLAGSNLTAQLLKDHWLLRPDYGLTDRPVNTLPSGHTTAAAAVAATALLIVPSRWRGPVALIGAVYSGLTGVGTLVLGWHRPSDIAAAYALVAVWYFAVEGARGLRLRPLPRGYGEAPAGNASVWLWFVGGLGLLLGVVGIVLTFTQVPGIETRGEVFAYLTSAVGLAGIAAAAMAAMLGMRPFHDGRALGQMGPR